MKSKTKVRIVVAYNRDFEQADADPENCARADIEGTAAAVLQILRAAGHDVREIGVGNDVHAVMREIAAAQPAIVFNLCESIGVDNRLEALLPMMLDLAGLAYTGSPALALALALHKHKAKEILRASGIPTPKGTCFRGCESDAAINTRVRELGLRFPLMVKPAREDASVGITCDSVVRTMAALAARVRHVLQHYRQPAIVEEFIEGREINVSVLARNEDAPEVLPLHEIDFSDMPTDRPCIMSFEGKWDESSPEFSGTRSVAAQLPAALAARLRDLALRGFEAMELRDYGRFDFRVAADGTPYVIDVNPNCDLSPQEGFARAAAAAGLSYEDLVLRIVDLALARRVYADPIPVV